MRRRPAFTLVELLVVMSIVALLVGLLLPALAAARGAGRSAVCLSNLRQTTLATLNYAVSSGGSLVPLVQPVAGGRAWWFGLEPQPYASVNRPIDPSRSPLAAYADGVFGDGLACPDFPAGDPAFFAKFATRSAHFGYSGGLAPPPPFAADRRTRRLVEVRDAAGTFAFADAVHQDFDATRFNEPHEVGFRCAAATSGAAHHRHGNRSANVSFVDGHAAARQPPAGAPVWATFAGGPVVNLDVAQGPGTLYGFDTWSAGLCPP